MEETFPGYLVFMGFPCIENEKRSTTTDKLGNKQSISIIFKVSGERNGKGKKWCEQVGLPGKLSQWRPEEVKWFHTGQKEEYFSRKTVLRRNPEGQEGANIVGSSVPIIGG